MLEKIRTQTKYWLWNSNKAYSADSILEKLLVHLNRELNRRIKELSEFTDSLPVIEALHLVIDNLTNTIAEVKRALRSKSSVSPDFGLALLDEQIKRAEEVLQIKLVSKSSQASEIGNRVLNLLFCAKQTVKSRFSVITPIQFDEGLNHDHAPSPSSERNLLIDRNKREAESLPRLVVSSTLLYQIHHALFPAERMLVAAGKRDGQSISIEAVFDVTGVASAGGVRADSKRLARALIAMSETETYFALWIHSHPGRGKDASRPSSIDRNQEIDWLRDYSADLVNAIMVEDRFVRFWGKALEEKRVAIEVAGTGVRKETGNENIYRLEC